MERHANPSITYRPGRRQRKPYSLSGPVLGGLVALFLVGLFSLYRANVFETQPAPAAATVAPATADSLEVHYPPSVFPSTADLGAHPMFAPLVDPAPDTLPKIFVERQQ
ncbi:hypothetical protein [Rufibacter soli]